jgi:hypothetical protein
MRERQVTDAKSLQAAWGRGRSGSLRFSSGDHALIIDGQKLVQWEPRLRTSRIGQLTGEKLIRRDFCNTIVTCACTACGPTNANPEPSIMSHGLIVVPRSLRMFQ